MSSKRIGISECVYFLSVLLTQINTIMYNDYTQLYFGNPESSLLTPTAFHQICTKALARLGLRTSFYLTTASIQTLTRALALGHLACSTTTGLCRHLLLGYYKLIILYNNTTLATRLDILGLLTRLNKLLICLFVHRCILVLKQYSHNLFHQL